MIFKNKYSPTETIARAITAETKRDRPNAANILTSRKKETTVSAETASCHNIRQDLFEKIPFMGRSDTLILIVADAKHCF
jgi:hypothetical protein